MDSRTKILSKIKENKPDHIDLPDIDVEYFSTKSDLTEQFKTMVETVGGRTFSIDSDTDLLEKVISLYPKAKNNYSYLSGNKSFNTVDIKALKNPAELENLDILILEGIFGVAENGAIWLTENEIPIRVLPFIAKHLVLVIDHKKMVQTMHEAYKIIHDFDYGLFISGPSKTADIEQALVIGAQGALNLDVFIK